MFFPVICRIKMTLNEWLMSSNVVISTMAKSMVAKFDTYWNVIHKLMGVACKTREIPISGIRVKS